MIIFHFEGMSFSSAHDLKQWDFLDNNEIFSEFAQFIRQHILTILTIKQLYYFIPLLQGKSCYSIFIIKYQNEPVHEKTVPITFATSVDPHQPAHLCSLVRIHTVEV